MEPKKSFQEQIPNNHCFGCGPQNEQGLKIHSYWKGENESVCSFTPLQHHSAGPLHFLNGGIISTIIDCHCVCTAIAKGYKMRSRNIGIGETVWFATGNLDIKFLKPVPIDSDVQLIASISEAKDHKIMLNCDLFSGGDLCCQSTIIAVKVPNEWFEPRS
ncbi:PaaI family thioesterase [Vibrio pectenicida]|uniref:Acyl-coenzyme A thioesterase THEM4 n=1 Tax=Vibrio pectenicida TaxID=62763 RepID=A0A7Y4EF63_9VIBR|nr:hotdog domain-containing protein [Vibrio pectenicida]NOH72217.1 PaaI family thioesterase [Vibrio pectenicida]